MANQQHPNLEKQGRFWHYKLQVNGRRVHGSTKATDLATAKRILEERRRELLEGRSRVKESSSIFLGNLMEEWLTCHRPTHSEKHCRGLESITRIWLLPAMGDIPIDQIRTSAVLALRANVLTQGKSATTANNILRHLKLLLNHAVRIGYLEKMPVRVTYLRAQQRPKPVLPWERAQEFLQVIDELTSDPQRRCAVRVAMGMALREGELLTMKWNMVDSNRLRYTVYKAKGKEVRTVLIPEWVWASIQALPRTTGDWVLPDLKTGKPHRPNFLRGLLERAGDRLGIPGLSQHRLRASWASWQAELNTPVHLIASAMGHKSASVTLGWYVVSNLQAQQNAQDKLTKQLGLGVEV